MSFSYDLVNNKTREFYDRMLALDIASFATWRSRFPLREALPLKQAFRSWWLLKGRTGFKTAADAVRYREELFTVALLAGAVTGEALQAYQQELGEKLALSSDGIEPQVVEPAAIEP